MLVRHDKYIRAGRGNSPSCRWPTRAVAKSDGRARLLPRCRPLRPGQLLRARRRAESYRRSQRRATYLRRPSWLRRSIRVTGMALPRRAPLPGAGRRRCPDRPAGAARPRGRRRGGSAPRAADPDRGAGRRHGARRRFAGPIEIRRLFCISLSNALLLCGIRLVRATPAWRPTCLIGALEFPDVRASAAESAVGPMRRWTYRSSSSLRRFALKVIRGCARKRPLPSPGSRRQSSPAARETYDGSGVELVDADDGRVRGRTGEELDDGRPCRTKSGSFDTAQDRTERHRMRCPRIKVHR
jgi:hypothetical protein